MTGRGPPPASASENHLRPLAERAILKPWAIPSPFRQAGKELADLLVPFGEDIVVFSDKACAFDADKPLDVAWARWARAAIDGGVRQLGGAVRRLERPDNIIFTDQAGRDPLAYPVPPPGQRRYHLVNIVRPEVDPRRRPAGWRGLTWSDEQNEAPFVVGPRSVGGRFVHVFDGEDLDLLLDHLDTAPDFIEYLASRETLLSGKPGITFAEPDLLALATANWMRGRGFTVDLLAGGEEDLRPGAWADYVNSERAELSRKASRPSYAIDQIVREFHREHLTRRAQGVSPKEASRHEEAMRLLAREGRFARRIIVASLESILAEADQSTFWLSTACSPTTAGVRYLWLTYPKKPDDMSEETFTETVNRYLRQNLVVASDTFPDEDTFVGLAWPNRSAQDTLLIMNVFDASDRGPALKAEADHLRRQGVLEALEAEHRLHYP